jgi:hypothetical protein
MELLAEVTPKSWLDDIQFVLTLMGKHSPEEEMDFLEEYLIARYRPQAVLRVFSALGYCRNWLVRNLDYLKEVGLRTKTGIYHCVSLALLQVVTEDPREEAWAKIPDIDPRLIVSKAQEWIDAEKRRESSSD